MLRKKFEEAAIEQIKNEKLKIKKDIELEVLEPLFRTAEIFITHSKRK